MLLLPVPSLQLIRACSLQLLLAKLHLTQQASTSVQACYILAPAQVEEGTAFAPLVRGEIGGFAWHVIADLPATKQSSLLTFSTPEGARHKFFNVSPTWKSRSAYDPQRYSLFGFEQHAAFLGVCCSRYEQSV